jgi:hypothetical protein
LGEKDSQVRCLVQVSRGTPPMRHKFQVLV